MNTLPLTEIKRAKLRETYGSFLQMTQKCFALVETSKVKSSTELHRLTYREHRKRFGVAAQLVCEARRYAWGVRKTANRINYVIVRFDRHLFSLKTTRRGNPALSVRANSERVGLPIAQDGGWRRLQTHLGAGWEISSVIMKFNLKFLVALRKDDPQKRESPNVLGVDINAGSVAVTIRSAKGKVLKQLYLGQDLARMQAKFERRRAKLQAHRDTHSQSKAGKKLKRFSRRQRNYTRTRCWQLVGELVKLAKRFDARIAIERLKYLRKRRGEWGKRSRKKVNRIPYGFLRFALEHKAVQEGITIETVSARYTSQTCPRCDLVNKANRRNFHYFKCIRCGFEANADRVASLNICRRAGERMVTYAQVPVVGGAVNRRVLSDDGGRRHLNHLEGQAPSFRAG
ncbi:MAG: transposase [Hadesarchaea archaeon]|nr:transposase [Hadesarchaea archaeon]